MNEIILYRIQKFLSEICRRHYFGGKFFLVHIYDKFQFYLENPVAPLEAQE